jgi:hypothetical protein
MRRIESDTTDARVNITFAGRDVEAVVGDSVAAALLAAGETPFRTTPVSGAPRAPYCMMGVCFDCLVSVDEIPNQQACMVVVREGMRVDAMIGARGVAGTERDESESHVEETRDE